MTALPVNEATSNDLTDNGEKSQQDLQLLLDQSLLYQNSVTGAISTAPLLCRQLCRIMCPVTGVQVPHHLNADTQMLALEADGSYSDTGWKLGRSLPVIREAVATWYYEGTATTTIAEVQGPVSCRTLADLWRKQSIKGNTRVYSETCPEWTTIDKVSSLRTALQAFDTVPPIWNQPDHQKQVVEEAIDTDVIEQVDAATDDMSKEVHDELEAFLSFTASMGAKHNGSDDDGGDDEGYNTDGGSRYVKDPRTGNWIHEALAPKAQKKKAALKKSESAVSSSTSSSHQHQPAKRKRKTKFQAKNAKCWVYVTGLPVDTTEEEIASLFGKAGIIDLDPESQRPKIKLYKHKDGPVKGQCKGDGSICFARAESVDLALTLLDESQFRPSVKHTAADSVIRVQRAKFEQHGEEFDDKRARISNAKRKVAKLAAIQATDWDEGEFNGRLTGGRKGLRIIVLKHLFDPSTLVGRPDEDARLASIEKDLRIECEEWGVVEKITVFSQHRDGVVIVKFTQPGAASDAVKELDGRMWKDVGRIEAIFWDGVTDFTVRDEVKETKEAEKRQEEFGNWLETQELPEELRLKVDDA
jgi:hypothetical protein